MLRLDNLLLVLLLSFLLLTGCSTTGKLHDTETSPRYLKAKSLMESGQFERAIPVLQTIVDDNPEMTNAAVNLAIAYRESGQITDALDLINSVIAMHPNHIAAYNQLGIIQRHLGHFDKALSAYQRAIELNANYALARRNLGILYDIYLQQYTNALGQYEKYQTLTDASDKEVDKWIIDLKRRIDIAQSRDGQ